MSKGQSARPWQIRYCEYWCGPLSQEQIVMVRSHVQRSTFLGVGRMPGYVEYYPMVLIGNNPMIVDRAGHYSVAALEGRRSYEYETSCATCDKASGECSASCFWEE